MSEARNDGVHGVAPAYPARRGDARRSASTRISMLPTMLIKCSTNCQREESGGKSTKCVHESIHNFLKQKSNTNSTEFDSSGAYKSNKDYVPREPGHGWPRPGRRAWPPHGDEIKHTLGIYLSS
jgi:hypothetical protein